MKTSIAAFLLGFVVSVWLTPLARRMAIRYRLVDRAQDGRRINEKDIPRAGGLAIAAGVLVPILGLAFYENAISHAVYEDIMAFLVLVAGALAALGVGLLDDLYRPSAKLRLLALITIAVASWIAGHRVDEAVIPGLGPITMGPWSLPVTVLWIVGVVVAFNFVDGLDGLATGIALISTATLFIYAQIDHNVLWMTWTGAMAGALLGFLVFNFNPASIFMGDAGSNFLGYLLAVVALQTSRKEATAVSLVVPLCVLGLPLLDVTLTMVRRTLLRQGLFTSERGHLHHRLLQLGLSHRHAVLVLYAVTAILCLGAVSMTTPLLYLHLIIAALITLVVFSLMFVTGYIRPRDLLQMYRQGKANETRQQQVEVACQELAQYLDTVRGAAVELPQILAEVVERGRVTAVQYRCEHHCEVVAGAYDRSAKGARHQVTSGRSGADAVLVFWKDRTDDPTPREIAALRKLFAGIECSCTPTVSPMYSGGSRVGPTRKSLSRPSAKAQLDKVWAALVESAERLSIFRIQLAVELSWLSEEYNATWQKDAPEEMQKSWRIDVPLMSETGVVGWLRVVGDSSRASSRQDIASLLDVLDTSESYLKSVFRDHAHAPIAGTALHSDLDHGRSAQAAAELVEAGVD